MIKFNSTFAFILLFVVVTISSGFLSLLVGYTLGYEALKQVSQPDVKPGQKQLAEQNNQSSEKQTIIVSEAEIIEKVNVAMNQDQEKAIPLNGQKATSNAANNDSFIESP
ncbi:MAG: hypothetical protein GVY04_19990 [Cyanobacteria bacterium]|jgi:hypothetical protein|nr:hypothetical protein [Cyanobacteria bacterium GSL.Bin1]